MEATKWFYVDISVDREDIESPAMITYVLDAEERAVIEGYLKTLESEDGRELQPVIFAYAGQGLSTEPGTMVFLPEGMIIHRAAPLSDFTPPLNYEIAKATALSNRPSDADRMLTFSPE